MKDMLNAIYKMIENDEDGDRIRREDILRAGRTLVPYLDKISQTMGEPFAKQVEEALCSSSGEECYAAFLEGVRLGCQVGAAALCEPIPIPRPCP